MRKPKIKQSEKRLPDIHKHTVLALSCVKALHHGMAKLVMDLEQEGNYDLAREVHNLITPQGMAERPPETNKAEDAILAIKKVIDGPSEKAELVHEAFRKFRRRR